jgi:hypothetical protein
MDTTRLRWLAAAPALVSLMSCDGTNQGTVQFFVQAEATITDGLDPGSGLENIRDGWAVRYDKFLVGLGDVRATSNFEPGTELSVPSTFVVDLKSLPTGGLVLRELVDVDAVRWDRVGYSMRRANQQAVPAAGISQADFDFMVAGQRSVYFEGRITKAGGQSCAPFAPVSCVARDTVTFRWSFDAQTRAEDCASEDGVNGFAVPSGGTVAVKPTIHGDHWFFNNITQGAEITERRAQWLANADLNRDGETTLDELRQIPASTLFPSPTYNLSGALTTISTAYDVVEAQVRTLGDFNGEGECPTRTILP